MKLFIILLVESALLIILSACGMAIALFILVFIICAVCIKKKKTNDKLKPFTVSKHQVSYTNLEIVL